jgi:hypothetical protein
MATTWSLAPSTCARAAQPFGSTAVHLASSALLVAVSSPFANIYILPLARKGNPGIPLLDVDFFHHTAVLSVSHAFRFLDCWTDMSVTILLWGFVSSGDCVWYDGSNRCGRYVSMAIGNVVFAAFDFCIAVAFVLFGAAIEASGSRVRRVAIGLHFFALLCECGRPPTPLPPGHRVAVHVGAPYTVHVLQQKLDCFF